MKTLQDHIRSPFGGQILPVKASRSMLDTVAPKFTPDSADLGKGCIAGRAMVTERKLVVLARGRESLWKMTRNNRVFMFCCGTAGSGVYLYAALSPRRSPILCLYQQSRVYLITPERLDRAEIRKEWFSPGLPLATRCLWGGGGLGLQGRPCYLALLGMGVTVTPGRSSHGGDRLLSLFFVPLRRVIESSALP